MRRGDLATKMTYILYFRLLGLSCWPTLDIISRSIYHVNNNVKLQSLVHQFKFVRSCESRSLENGNNNEEMTNIIVTMDMRPLNPRGHGYFRASVAAYPYALIIDYDDVGKHA